MSRRFIGVFIVAIVVLLSTLDIYLAWDSIDGNTYSERIREWGVRFGWLPYLLSAFFGVLLSHWFSKRDKAGPLSRNRKVLVTIGLGLSVALGLPLGLLW